jgi:hypothetical protein
MHTQYFLALFFIIWSTFPVVAYGSGHEDCDSCHKNTSREDYTLVFKNKTEGINPSTKKPYGKMDALCYSCHEQNSQFAHPVGIIPDPQKVIVPEDALGFPGQEQEITCLSCHNPHPDNKSYQYLRWQVEDEDDMTTFCVKCHASQGSDVR